MTWDGPAADPLCSAMALQALPRPRRLALRPSTPSPPLLRRVPLPPARLSPLVRIGRSTRSSSAMASRNRSTTTATRTASSSKRAQSYLLLSFAPLHPLLPRPPLPKPVANHPSKRSASNLFTALRRASLLPPNRALSSLFNLLPAPTPASSIALPFFLPLFVPMGLSRLGQRWRWEGDFGMVAPYRGTR